MGEQQVAELSSQLVIARAQSAEARARLDRIETVLHADSPDATVDSTVADTLKNDVITKLRSQYLEYKQRTADWTARVGPNHLAVVNLRNEMAEIRKSILDELRRIAESYKSDYQIAKQREEGIQKELSQAISVSQETDQAQVTLHELESNSQTYRALYDNFLQRYMESVQQQSFPITEARVISPASRPLQQESSQDPYCPCHQRTRSDDPGFRNWDAAGPVRSRFPHQRASRERAADRLHCARAVIGRRRPNCKVASRRDRLGYCQPKNDRGRVVALSEAGSCRVKKHPARAKGYFGPLLMRHSRASPRQSAPSSSRWI